MYARLYHEGGIRIYIYIHIYIYIYIYIYRERKGEEGKREGERNYDEWHFEISKCTARKIMGGRV